MLGEKGELGLCAVGELVEEQAEQARHVPFGKASLNIVAAPEPHGNGSGIEDPAPGHVAIRP
nr:hypothetical protein GCM10010200_045600 [Actinomadura rugatobispora]